LGKRVPKKEGPVKGGKIKNVSSEKEEVRKSPPFFWGGGKGGFFFVSDSAPRTTQLLRGKGPLGLGGGGFFFPGGRTKKVHIHTGVTHY